MKKMLLVIGLFISLFCYTTLLNPCHAADDESITPYQNGYHIGYMDGFNREGYNNPSDASDDWKNGYHTGYFTGKDNYQNYSNGYHHGYTNASTNKPIASPIGSSKFFIKGSLDGYNAYHKEFKVARQDGYMDGCNSLPIKNLSKNSATYQKGYHSGYDYAIAHGMTEYYTAAESE